MRSSKALKHRTSRSWRSTMNGSVLATIARPAAVDDAQSPVALIHNLRD
jgi:hypothetical protein